MAAVLVPYDGSKLSTDALAFACERFPEAEITALFIVDTTVAHQPEQYVGVKLGDIYEQRETEGERILEDAEEFTDEHDVQLSTAIRKGRPSKEILEYVTEHGIDHVVIGSHSQDLIERFFVGSVAERVVDRIPVPVTVIR
ncbi:universal stress protein [Natronomonas sp. F2-12]|jgi:nucleotide-binding universal stress UspA family protein|uniref:Universal stress protein n=1 Tax=Natronomonas aquatica TaxID=2841590 RepID=A0A9R1D4L0_9EURY|nr:universal stress protein [Natronomonas aquatica]MCQ4333479.1 universal stress protein [Natronomonas aquatica]